MLLPKVIVSETNMVPKWKKIVCVYWLAMAKHHFTLPGWKRVSLLCGRKRNYSSLSVLNWFIRLPSDGNTNSNWWLSPLPYMNIYLYNYKIWTCMSFCAIPDSHVISVSCWVLKSLPIHHFIEIMSEWCSKNYFIFILKLL